jgi:F420-non-reducing hydrogenase iron-sulfur subunit
LTLLLPETGRTFLKGEKMKTQNFEPRIIAFLCNWCTYGAADLAGVSRLSYPPNIRVIRVMCSGTVSPHHILRGFQSGADGILVGG